MNRLTRVLGHLEQKRYFSSGCEVSVTHVTPLSAHDTSSRPPAEPIKPLYVINKRKFHNEFKLDLHNDPNFVLFAGRAHPELAADTARFLKVPLAPLKLKGFQDGEVSIQMLDSVRGKNVFIIQPVCRRVGVMSVNDALVELCLMISVARRQSANRITAVLPYYGYARQDRTLGKRVPISAANVAQMLVASGVDTIMSVDLHVGQIEGFFPARIPVDNLSAGPMGACFFASRFKFQNPIVVSPDAGGVFRAQNFRNVLAQELKSDVSLAIIVKQRSGASQIKSMDLVGSVKGGDAIIVDDMIDTAGTLVKAAALLKQKGATRVFAFATHGVFSGPAAERINSSVLSKVVVCNSLPLPDQFIGVSNVLELSIAPLLAEAIGSIYRGSSLTDGMRRHSELLSQHNLKNLQDDINQS